MTPYGWVTIVIHLHLQYVCRTQSEIVNLCKVVSCRVWDSSNMAASPIMFVFRLTIRKLPVELTSETGQTGPEFDTLSLVSILSSNVRWVKSRTSTTGCVKSGFPICTEATERGPMDGADDSVASSIPSAVASILSELERTEVTVVAYWKLKFACE